jgi:hypothetical protein
VRAEAGEERRDGLRAFTGCVYLRLASGARVGGTAVRTGQCSLRRLLGLLQFLLGWRGLFVPIVVVVVAGPAADFGRLFLHERNDGMIGKPATLHAKIVDYIAQSLFTHFCSPTSGVYQDPGPGYLP